MRILLAVFFALCVAVSPVVSTPTKPVPVNGSAAPAFYLVQQRNGSQLEVQTTPPAYNSNYVLVATARWAETRLQIGWDYLQLTPHVWGDDAYFYAGYLEGYLTSNQTNLGVAHPQESQSGPQHRRSLWGKIAPAVLNRQVKAATCEEQWMADHFEYVQYQMYNATHGYENKKFWDQYRRLWRQMEGIAAGYTAKTGASGVDSRAVYLYNFVGAGEVQAHCSLKKYGYVTKEIKEYLQLQATHCSALVRPTADDLFVSHDTWTTFPGALTYHIYKVYEFPEVTVAFSGTAGYIASNEDWYITSKQLAIQETTNEVFNTSLYKYVVPQTVDEFARVMVATYIAETGQEWSHWFAFNNSGTYNNQYMVVDFKRYEPGKPIQDGVLWVAEQLPGYVESGDVSYVLRESGYWGSYNIPFFPKIYEMSGYTQAEAQQGTFWSYTKYARAEIFRRNHTDVVDIESMQHMMRYNNYLFDPFSKIPNCSGATGGVCDPSQSSMLTIASRGDLLKVYPTNAENIAHYGPLYGLVAQGCFGATDSKIARWQWRDSLLGLVVHGPTNDQVPTFNWSGACQGQKPANAAPEYDFPWLEISPSRQHH